MAGRRSASMDDVAQRAGVALATVSNALNHPHKVAAPTRRRIDEAIEELGYIRNNQARFLASGKSHIIGLVVTDLGNSFFVDIARGAEEQAEEAALSLVIANSDNRMAKEETYLDLFVGARYDGILLAPFEASGMGLERVRRHGRPLVLLNVEGGDDTCSVVVDNELGGYLAARHLIDRGRRRLAFVGGPDRLEPLLQRRVGVERAVAEASPAVHLEELITSAVNTPEGRAVGRELSDRPVRSRPDGIVAASDLLAVGIIQALRAADISIPEDIAVIGYDNNSAALESEVALSTVAQPGHEMGVEAARLLQEEILDKDAHRHRRVRLAPRVISRASSAV